MNYIVAILGMLVVDIALWAIMTPNYLRRVLLGWQSRSRFYVAILIRLGAGILFVLAAPETRYPAAIYVIGGLMILAGMVIAAMGQPRMDAMIERMLPTKSGVIRLYALAGMLFGAFLIYAGL